MHCEIVHILSDPAQPDYQTLPIHLNDHHFIIHGWLMLPILQVPAYIFLLVRLLQAKSRLQ